MSEQKFKDFEVDGATIYRIIRKPIRAKFVLIKRGTLQRNIAELCEHIKRHQEDLTNLEAEAAFYNSSEMDALLRRQAEEEKAAAQRAQELLKQFIGEQNFKVLMKEGRLRFTAKNGRKYEIKPNGTVYSISKGRYRLCIIRPKNLPLPDVVLAVLASVKSEPQRFREIRRR